MGLQYGFSHVGFRYLSNGFNRRSLPHPAKSTANHVQVLAIAGDMARPIYVKQYAVCHGLMISKCANPQCAKTLMRMDGGRFFGFHTKTQGTKSTTLENFWLCSNCSRSYTLRQVEGRVELLSRDRKSA